jgi:hypothetical protein
MESFEWGRKVELVVRRSPTSTGFRVDGRTICYQQRTKLDAESKLLEILIAGFEARGIATNVRIEKSTGYVGHSPLELTLIDEYESFQIVCSGCCKQPEELEEYVELAKDTHMTASEIVVKEEGTYNPENGHFLCTPCYVKAGMPTSSSGWKCP